MVKRMVAGFCSIGGWCYSEQWMWDLSTLAQFQGSEIKTQGQSKISFFGFVWCKLRELGGRVSPRFPCVIPVMESFPSDLLPAISYWTKSHPESCKTARRSSAKIINSLKKSTISARKLHCRCLTGCKMRLWLERCCKCRVKVDCKCMEFVAAGWCAGKYLRPDRTLSELGMFDNYSIDRKTFYTI